MNKILLVAGASSDIGAALIKKTAKDYKLILAHYFHWNSQLEELQHAFPEKIIFLQADFSNVDNIQQMLYYIHEHRLEPDHVVFFPALKSYTKKFAKTEWESFDKGWEISVRSSVLIAQNLLPYMQKKKYGKIIFMLTSYTCDSPPKYQVSYTTVKYALLGLLKSLAVEYADKGITINGVSPDMIQTKFLSELPQILIDQYAEGRPQKKLLQVEDVIPAFIFLLSEGADNISGENIRIY